MSKKKSLQELTFKSNFMFGAVMLNPEICKGVLERSLGIEIERVEVSKEKSIVYNPEYKGIRLDVYAKNEDNTHYDVEIQVLKRPAIKKRARYYHGQLDMEILLSGLSYRDLPDTYVIFICDFDPFGQKKYRYTLKKICEESEEVSMEDEFIRQLQNSIKEVKESREMGARYMTFEELLADEFEDGRLSKVKELVEKKLKKGCSIENIADILEEDIDVIRGIVTELQEKSI